MPNYNATHFLQPLDVAVLKTAKLVWAKIIDENNQSKDFKIISKDDFPSLLKQLVESKKAFLRRHAVAGFEATGIFPLDRNIVDRSQFIKTVEYSDSDSSDSSSSSDSYSSDDSDDSDVVTQKEPNKKPFKNITNKNDQSKSNHEIISSIVSEHFKSKSILSSTKSSSKRKLVAKNGLCLTSDDSLQFMREEQLAKKIKLEETERKRVEKENKKAQEIFEKAKAQEAKNELRKKKQEQNRIFQETRRRNKALKKCHKCDRSKENDKKHQKHWISCFRCQKWCCYKCMPDKFKRACNQVYRCEECSALSAENETEILPNIDY